MNSDGVVALVLAAGCSKRFGSMDKRIAKLDSGEGLLANVAANTNKLFEQSFVVLRDIDTPANLGLKSDQSIIRTENAHLGMGASLSAGFKYLLNNQHVANCHACAVFLADMPAIDDKTVAELTQASARDLIVRPMFNGKPGHPVIFGRSFWRELSEIQPNENGKTVIQNHNERCIWLDTDDAGVLLDIDTPADLNNP